MLNKLRPHNSLLIGFGVLVLMLDGLIAFFRRIGMDKGTAIPIAIISLVIGLYFVFQRHLRKQSTLKSAEPDASIVDSPSE